jgi:hypothetical protein
MVTDRTLVIQPMNWMALQDLSDTPPLDASDEACLEDLRQVLARHGKLRRFAIHLAHRHFDVADDEVLIEQSDHGARTQSIRVVPRATVTGAVPTTWMFDERPALHAAAVYCVCAVDPVKQDGCVRHGKSGSPGEAAQRDEAAKQKRISEEKGEHERGFPVGGHDWDRER